MVCEAKLIHGQLAIPNCDAISVICSFRKGALQLIIIVISCCYHYNYICDDNNDIAITLYFQFSNKVLWYSFGWTDAGSAIHASKTLYWYSFTMQGIDPKFNGVMQYSMSFWNSSIRLFVGSTWTREFWCSGRSIFFDETICMPRFLYEKGV